MPQASRVGVYKVYELIDRTTVQDADPGVISCMGAQMITPINHDDHHKVPDFDGVGNQSNKH